MLLKELKQQDIKLKANVPELSKATGVNLSAGFMYIKEMQAPCQLTSEAGKNTLQRLVEIGFSNWRKAKERLHSHQNVPATPERRGS